MKLILAQCPRCKTRFKVAAEKVAGKKLRCASCRQAFRIPATAASGGVAKKGAAKKPQPVESDEIEIVEDFEGEVELFDDSEEHDFPVDEFEDFSDQPVARSSRALPARVSSRPARATSATEPEGEEQQQDTKKTIALIASVSVVGLLVIGGLIFAGASGKLSFTPKVEVPTEYVDFFPEVGPFNCKYPKGWKLDSGGGSGGSPAYVRFEKGSTVISIRVSIKGSIQGDAAKATANQALALGGRNLNQMAEEEDPVNAVHMQERELVEPDFYDYVEDPPQVIEVPYGSSRISNFKARHGFLKSNVRGVHATSLSVDALRIVCRCPEKDFDKMRPVFETVIKSVQNQ